MGCIEQGLDKTWGGTLYNMTGMLGSELVNAANALAALRQVVYEDGDISLAALKAALATDFAGLQGERLRLRLRNRCPKFGNDDERVDSLAAEIAALFISEGQAYANPRGGRYCLGFFDFAGYVTAVKSLGATPDGRRAGESVSGHLAPVGGRSGLPSSYRRRPGGYVLVATVWTPHQRGAHFASGRRLTVSAGAATIGWHLISLIRPLRCGASSA